MNRILLLALAGAAGTLARYWVSGAVYAVMGRNFPWGTAAANILGSFLFGLVWVLADERLIISGETRTIILVGFMGAFTTFSTYMFETGEMIRSAQWFSAGINFLGQGVLGVVCLTAGMALGKLI